MSDNQIKELTKLYYSIGEVGDMFNVNASLLRFWEREFNIHVEKKNKKGNRLYSPKEIRQIEEIYQLVKIKGFTLVGAKQQLAKKTDNGKLKNSELTAIIQQLEIFRSKLIAIKSL